MRLSSDSVRIALARVFGGRVDARLELADTLDDRAVGPALIKALAPAVSR